MKDLSKYKITVFGDSIPKGVFLDNKRLKKTEVNAVSMLERDFGLNIDNRSNFGQTLARLIAKGEIDKFVSNLNQNDKNFVVFSIGGNDADYDWKSIPTNPQIEHGANTDLDSFEQILQQSIQLIQSKGVRVAVTTLLPVHSQRFFDNVICTLADGEQVLKFLNNDVDNISRHQQCYNDCILRVAIRNSCDIIDLRKQFCMLTNYQDYMCMDGIHPNDEGQALMAHTVAQYVNSRIAG